MTFNQRRKTISTTKREFALGAALLETPEGCFLDIVHNAYDLLTNSCGMQVPQVNDPVDFFVGRRPVCAHRALAAIRQHQDGRLPAGGDGAVVIVGAFVQGFMGGFGIMPGAVQKIQDR